MRAFVEPEILEEVRRSSQICILKPDTAVYGTVMTTAEKSQERAIEVRI